MKEDSTGTKEDSSSTIPRSRRSGFKAARRSPHLRSDTGRGRQKLSPGTPMVSDVPGGSTHRAARLPRRWWRRRAKPSYSLTAPPPLPPNHEACDRTIDPFSNSSSLATLTCLLKPSLGSSRYSIHHRFRPSTTLIYGAVTPSPNSSKTTGLPDARSM